MAKTYLEKKNELRDEAKKLQAYISDNNLAWWDIYDCLQELEIKAKKYGLLREFKENGIL